MTRDITEHVRQDPVGGTIPSAVPPDVPPRWWCTGVSWRGGQPALTLVDVDGREHTKQLRYGTRLGVQIIGSRRCIGIWRGDVRSCPFDSPLTAAQADAQCDACAAADPGRALARDATVDARTFRVYLATFGAGVLKVGITAAERGPERLREQGALAFTWLAEGSHPAARAAEAAVAAARMATERPRRAAKLAGWTQRGDLEQRRRALTTVATAAHRLPTWPAEATPTVVDVVDHAELYGLAAYADGSGGLPEHLEDVDQFTPGAILTGRIRALIGPELVLDPQGSEYTADQVQRGLVISGRTLAGWPVVPVVAGAGGIHQAGYRTQPLPGPEREDASANHPALF
jgi:hypothetical protein